MKASLENGMIVVSFDYRKHLIRLMHRLGGVWDKGTRTWALANTERNQLSLHAAGFRGVEKPVLHSSPFAIPPLPPYLRIVVPYEELLRPYQKQGVARIDGFSGRALLADEMGLGKTVQALTWLTLRKHHRPAIVVCPASLKWNWKREAAIWCPGEKAVVLDGTNARPPRNGVPPIIIINYDVLNKWERTLRDLHPAVIVLDESHRIKNRTAQRTKAVLRLCADVPHVLCLSGTPVLQRPEELWTTLRILRPDVFTSWWDFGMRYCDPKENRFSGGLEFRGCTNAAELNTLLEASCMIRRLKQDVLKELPPKIRTVVEIEMDSASRKTYSDAVAKWDREYLGAVERGDTRGAGAVAFRKFAELFGIIAEKSLPAKAAWVNDWLEDCDGKLIVFGHRHKMLHGLRDAIGAKRCVLVDGACKNRQAACERFENDKACRVLLGEFTAAGVGLNLTAASNVAFAELPWTPADLAQCEDRAHRIGQRSAVNVWLLVTRGTREQAIIPVLQSKAAVAGAVADGNAQSVLRLLHAAIRQ